jgi:hypothetical protein
MGQFELTAGNEGHVNGDLLNEIVVTGKRIPRSYSLDGGSTAVSTFTGQALDKLQERNLETAKLIGDRRVRYEFKQAGIASAGAAAVNGYTFSVETLPFSGEYSSQRTFYLADALYDAAGANSATGDVALASLISADRLGRGQLKLGFKAIWNGSSPISFGDVLYNTAYNTSEGLDEVEAVTADTDPAVGVAYCNRLLGTSIAADSLAFAVKCGDFIEAASGGSLNADIGWDASGLDSSSPASTIIGRTWRVGTDSTFKDGITYRLDFGASAFDYK